MIRRPPPARVLLGLGLLGLVACASHGDPYTVVTVTARPGVHDAASLSVTLSNGGTSRTDSLALASKPFPVTFSVTTPGRSGQLDIAIDALDDKGLIVGHGAASTMTTAATASLALDTTDFVVNTDYAGDQFPSSDFEANGFQLAALPDGTWTSVFRDDCATGSCTIFARRFDTTGKPVSSALAAGTNAFPLTTTPTTSLSTPAVGASGATTLAAWDAYPTGGGTGNIACRALDTTGRAVADQASVVSENADVVSVAGLANGNFAIAWNATIGADTMIRTAVVKPDCTVVVPALSVSLAGSNRKASVAANGDRVAYAWLSAGNLHLAVRSAAGSLVTADTVLVAATATDTIESARIAPVAGGFVIAARWAKITTGPGRIDLIKVTSAGALMGPATLITDKTGSDFDNIEAFGLASRSDGTLLAVWHSCGDASTDGSMCGVFGRFLSSAGAPLSDLFTVPTTTLGDQKRPSVVALPDAFVVVWADASGKPPDTAGLAVRARLVYPPTAAAAATAD